MPRQDADDAWAAHLALKPAEEASSSRSKSAAAVPDPFSARLLRFQPDGSSMAPVRTSVATEFNPGEQRYHTIKLRLQSIGNSAARGKRGDGRGEAPSQLLCDLCVLCGVKRKTGRVETGNNINNW